MTIPALIYLAPLLMVFELTQLVVAERYLGVKRLAEGGDPRERGPGEVVSFFWSSGIVLTWLWMLVMLAFPFGRLQILCMLGVSVIGQTVRRGCPLKWVLVILTLEGALRIGLLGSLIGMVWRAV